MVLASEVNFNHLIIDPFAEILGTAWLDTFHYSPRDIAIKIKRNISDHVILFKYWVTPASFVCFGKDTLNEFMHQQMDWIESNVGGLNFFDLINIETRELKIDSSIYVEFMFYLTEEKFNLAATLFKIKGYTNIFEKIYPGGLSMFYNCTSLTTVSFPANYNNKMAYYSTTLGGI